MGQFGVTQLSLSPASSASASASPQWASRQQHQQHRRPTSAPAPTPASPTTPRTTTASCPATRTSSLWTRRPISPVWKPRSAVGWRRMRAVPAPMRSARVIGRRGRSRAMRDRRRWMCGIRRWGWIGMHMWQAELWFEMAILTFCVA